MNSRFDRTVRNNNKKQQYNIGYIRRKNVGLAYYYNVHRGDKRHDLQKTFVKETLPSYMVLF